MTEETKVLEVGGLLPTQTKELICQN